MLKRLSISQKLYIEFIILFLLFTGIISFAIYRSNRMLDITNQLYQHPFQVIQSTGNIYCHILNIDYELIDLMTTKDPVKIQGHIKSIDGLTDNISKDLDIVSSRFLGDIALVIKTRELITKWNDTHKEIFALIRAGKYTQARKINDTKELAQEREINKEIKAIRTFAKGRAVEFQLEFVKNKTLTERLLYKLFLIYSIIALFLAIYIIRNITIPINDLIKAIDEFAKSDIFYTKIDINSDNEIGKLAGSFKNMAEKVNDRRFELIGANRQLQIEIKQREHEVYVRKNVERQIIRLNKVITVRSEINRIINQTKNMDELFTQACKIVIDTTQLLLAWIGIIDPASSIVVPKAHYGKGTGYLSGIKISSQDIPEGQGPCGTAIRLDCPIISNDIENDNSMNPWKKNALEQGFRSMASFPLHIDGRAAGSLSLYSGEWEYFNDKEVEVLKLIANDISLAMDVIEREDKNSKIREHMKRLSKVIEQSPSIVVITDKHGSIEYVNKAFILSTLYTYEDVIGKNINILKSGTMSKGEYKRLWGKITQGEEWSGEFCNKRQDGEFYWEYATIIPLKGDDGEIINFVKVAIDMTERRHLENQLRQSQKMEAIGQLTGGVAHDFNNILYAISNYAYLIRLNIEKYSGAYPDSRVLMNYVEGIQSSSERGAKLTQGLLAFSRKQMIHPTQIDINNTILGIEKMLTRLIREDITMKIDVFPQPLNILADGAQIDQILVNLTTNSRDAMPNGGVITISTQKLRYEGEFQYELGEMDKGMYGVITFSDTGSGMIKQIQEKVFEPFFTTKEVGHGTGLGLSTVFGAVRQNNGHINLYSEPGVGTTFKIYFPLIDVDHVEYKHTDKEISIKGTATILLAEDEADLKESTKLILEGNGYKVITAEDGGNAVTEFIRHADEIALVILDVIMPKKNGKAVYDEVIKIKPSIKVLFISGYSDDIIAEKGILTDDLYFISKPILPDILLKNINDILNDN